MALTQDDVLLILKLVEQSSFDDFRLELGDLRLRVSKGAGDEASAAAAPAAPAPVAAPPRPPAPVPPAPSEEGLTPLPSPMVGVFYRSPSPGAPPYVEPGSFVREEDTVGMMEVMKVFSAVKAGVRGHVERVCVENGAFVEYGETLFLIRAAA